MSSTQPMWRLSIPRPSRRTWDGDGRRRIGAPRQGDGRSNSAAYEAFVTARLWPKARLLRSANPDLPPLPEIRESLAALATGAKGI